jgi:hypothetical protein
VAQGAGRQGAPVPGQALPDDTPLVELLRDDRPAPDAELPRTGVSLAWERMLSSAFIRAPGYGTRCSTVIRRDRHGWTHIQNPPGTRSAAKPAGWSRASSAPA